MFPIRGHSYIEGDKDVSLVNSNAYTETPEDWRDMLRSSGIKPTPFTVISCATDVNFQTWTDFLTVKYVEKCSIPTRPIRVLKIDQKESKFLFHKSNFMTVVDGPGPTNNKNKTKLGTPKSATK